MPRSVKRRRANRTRACRPPARPRRRLARRSAIAQTVNVRAPIDPGRPIVLRGGTVLTMNDAHDVLHDADVLIVGERIAEVGPGLETPGDAVEIDATGGIVMPGMIDTHRHMWQTALRGYGADWTLTQ